MRAQDSLAEELRHTPPKCEQVQPLLLVGQRGTTDLVGSVDRNNVEDERMSFPSHSVTQFVKCGSMKTTGGSIHVENVEVERMSFPI